MACTISKRTRSDPRKECGWVRAPLSQEPNIERHSTGQESRGDLQDQSGACASREVLEGRQVLLVLGASNTGTGTFFAASVFANKTGVRPLLVSRACPDIQASPRPSGLQRRCSRLLAQPRWSARDDASGRATSGCQSGFTTPLLARSRRRWPSFAMSTQSLLHCRKPAGPARTAVS